MMGRVMWTEFFNNTDWPMAAAVTVVMVAILLVPLVIFQRNQLQQMNVGNGGKDAA
jgi:putrescine transport system permease protein